ncbi:MAG: 23S rRNA (pseudouridine(1915)-N(3))-methyltransferase RlmH [Lachnospiraceae bacterium]|nr:23S rRNA (pseudouridine(1915)-N(3))-methyltransferase RlmH [Lachnospiraceae bacterium]
MLHVTLIACGRLKEKYLKDAVAEYEKRLKGYTVLEIKELPDGPDPQAEALRIRQALPEDAFIVTLEIEGRELSSEEFSKSIEKLMTDGVSHICFITGGSDGIDPSVTDKADMHLSFSRMTFPHQLMRVIFLEQLYRAFKIMKGEPYHK